MEVVARKRRWLQSDDREGKGMDEGRKGEEAVRMRR